MMASENGHTAAVGTWPAGAFPTRPVPPPLPAPRDGCPAPAPSARGRCPVPPGSLRRLLGSGLSLLVAEFLLYQAKANITVLDVNKNTALHLACSKVGTGRAGSPRRLGLAAAPAPGLLPARRALPRRGAAQAGAQTRLGLPRGSELAVLPGRGGSGRLEIRVSVPRRSCCRAGGARQLGLGAAVVASCGLGNVSVSPGISESARSPPAPLPSCLCALSSPLSFPGP